MEIVKKELLKHKQELLNLLQDKNYYKLCRKLSAICIIFCLPKTKDDLSKYTPYEKGRFTEEYLNYSEITCKDLKYIAASRPRNVGAFKKLLKECDVVVSCISKINYVGKPVESKPMSLNGKVIFYDEYYDNEKVRILRFENWVDHDVMKKEEFEFFFKYFRKQEFKIPLIHCLAGIGRTGVFIMYDILYGRKVTHEEFLDILIELRSQRNGLVYSERQMEFLAENFINQNM